MISIRTAGWRRVQALLPALVACACVLAASPGSAVDLSVAFTDLTDTTPGRDLWQGRITITSDARTTEGDGASLPLPFVLGFEELRLVDPETAGGWHVVALPDAPEVPLEGSFEAFALAPAPALRVVDVEFVWTAAGIPSGLATENAPLPPPGVPVCVPEPSPRVLGVTAVGIIALLRRLRRRSRSARSSIEPLRSAKRTVTCLRSPSRAAFEVRIRSAKYFGV